MRDEKRRSRLIRGPVAHYLVLWLTLLLCRHAAHADLRLARPFGDHMVVQRGVDLPVWGTANAGREVSVQLGGQQQKTIADDDGNWRVTFSALEASYDPTSIEVQSGGQTVTVHDVLVGEVWLCAGQSNMEWPVSSSASAEKTLAAADNPQIRLLNYRGAARGGSGRYTEQMLSKMTPEKFCEGRWEVCSAETAKPYSAVGYYFGAALQRDLTVPIGLINVSIGGTPAEAWVSRDALAAHPQLKSLVDGNWLDNEQLGPWCRERAAYNLRGAMDDGLSIPGDDLGPNHSFKPGFMWESAVAPLTQFPIRGVVWYQGESNAQLDWRVRQHEAIFELLVTDWRKRFGLGDLSFLYVQLPGMGRPHWPEFREQQRQFLDRLPNVGMAVTIDAGHPTNVHPRTKKPVGERLALWALGTVYGKEVPYCGPMCDEVAAHGKEAVVTFDHAYEGLKTTGDDPPRHFEIAGEDRVFHSAEARIEDNTVVLHSPAVAAPRHVRYAWTPYPNPPVNLVNSAGLPASPFYAPCSQTDGARRPASRPNLLLIVADDMGFSDIGCYGGEANTPHLDRLAANGLRYTQFYNAARCCPTRASLLTGLYPHKTGIGFMTAQDHGKPGYRGDLGRECVTIAEALKAAGYNAYMAGKWHVCRDFGPDGPKHNWPLSRGFDRFFGTLIAAGSYWDPLTLVDGDCYTEPKGDFYYTEAITDKVVESIRQNDDKPFFAYVAYTAPHWPLHARREVIEKYRGRFAEGWDTLREARYERLVRAGIIDRSWKLSPRHPNVPAWDDAEDREWQQSRMAAYAATIDHVDQGIGRIVETLAERGQLDNTVIFFLSDNGGADLEHPDGLIGSTGRPWAVMRYVPLFTRDGQPVIAGDIPALKPGPPTTYAGYGGPWANLSNTPFRRFKKFTHEGGIATPLIVHWPNGIDAGGQLRRQVAHVIDLMPTCLELAQAKYPTKFGGRSIKQLDGTSLVPTFAGRVAPDRALFWEHRGNRAVRQADWKLVGAEGDSWELYNMATDRTETCNLADRNPKIVQRLSELYRRWAERTDVLPWSELKIPFIPPSENPLTRTEEELDRYFKELKVRGIKAPFAEK